VQTLFSDLVNEMNASLQRTPEILPVLGEAGVVDSGGAGLLYIIDGLNRVLNGEDVEDKEDSILPAPKSIPVSNSSFGPDSVMEYGYCTELLVQLMNSKTKENTFDLDALKLYLASYGDSIVAFQTESIVKIHVHTLRPDKIMRYMLKRGDFISVKVENMSLQHTELAAEEQTSEADVTQPKKKYGIVAVSNGDGISSLFRELGADYIVEGGQTNNPSTNDFIAAFDKINADNIFVFPNNGNIIMAAGQAAEIYEKSKVYVIPTKSIGAGYVAMSTMSFDLSEPDDLIAEAEEAINRITAAYVSPAVRDADMNGVHITDGDTMGIIGKEIVISGPDKMVSTYGLIDILLADTDRFMITIFYGKDVTTEERDQLAEYMLNTYPLVEAYYVDGGQEIYPFLFVAE
jgi:DAK2 domain fusion protein YloV